MGSPEKYLLSKERHELIFKQKIISYIFKNVKYQENPVAVIFGGQPGSGKSAAIAQAAENLLNRGGFALIIGDELRDYHPAYKKLLEQNDKIASLYTNKDISEWVEKAIAYAKELRCNLIIEGTMRLPEKVSYTMQSLRNAGYIIEAHVLAVNEKLSWQGVLQRYENQRADRGFGRMTTPEAHQAGYDGMLNAVEVIETEKLADKVVIYKRGAEIIYENELHNGEWKHEPLARVSVENERNRQWTLPERIAYARNFDTLVDLIKRPERNATEAEINSIISLQKEAYEKIRPRDEIKISTIHELREN